LPHGDRGQGLAGVFASMWTRLGSRPPTTPVKFAIGTIFMGLAFLLFLALAGLHEAGQRTFLLPTSWSSERPR
jgi:dipeptide/tripeptide permease